MGGGNACIRVIFWYSVVVEAASGRDYHESHELFPKPAVTWVSAITQVIQVIIFDKRTQKTQEAK